MDIPIAHLGIYISSKNKDLETRLRVADKVSEHFGADKALLRLFSLYNYPKDYIEKAEELLDEEYKVVIIHYSQSI
ncbi:hypothetical protein DRN75_01460 [Nanoarchaeota archaeon]|nr:MAG: hypothetical protein DRN75_01460 [Nanoarchaeota archaeon]